MEMSPCGMNNEQRTTNNEQRTTNNEDRATQLFGYWKLSFATRYYFWQAFFLNILISVSHVFTHSLKQTMTTLGEDQDNVTRCQNLHKWKTFISGNQFWSRWPLNMQGGRSYFKQYKNKNKVHLWASENHPFCLVCSWRKYLSVCLML